MTSVTQKKGRAQVLRERYGDDYFTRLAKKGGAAVRDKHGSEHFKKIGYLGGITTMVLYGPDFLAEIGAKGGRISKRKPARKEPAA